jgi:murein DD-endopeptidase MepM/ murein hydrolase activator NlpD
MPHQHPNESVFSYYAHFSVPHPWRMKIFHISRKVSRSRPYQPTLQRHFAMRVIFLAFSMTLAIPLGWWLHDFPVVDIGKMTVNNLSQPISPNSDPVVARWLTDSIQKGDDLTTIFERHQLNKNALSQLSHFKLLNKLHPTQALRIKQENGNVQELYLTIDFTKELHVIKQGNEFTSKIFYSDTQTDTVVVHGKVGNSLFSSAYAMGLSEQLTSKFLQIFHWDMDFHPLEASDTFTVVYQRYYRAGRTQAGDILAAEIVNQDKIYRAVRYVDPSGNVDYYKPNGTPLFNVIAPTEGSRLPIAPLKTLNISSTFGMRTHPVYHKKRFHNGIDYVVRYGTPIMAVADATVKYVGWQGGYGNTVILQHDEHRDTVYAHIARFAELKPEQQVKQGDVIGYVGKTGVTTGTHLHYEFRYDDEPRHPKELMFPPPNQPVQAATPTDMTNFLKNTQAIVAQLDNAGRGIAQNNSSVTTTSLAKAAGVVNVATRD